jgi:hypothetical protein
VRGGKTAVGMMVDVKKGFERTRRYFIQSWQVTRPLRILAGFQTTSLNDISRGANRFAGFAILSFVKEMWGSKTALLIFAEILI